MPAQVRAEDDDTVDGNAGNPDADRGYFIFGTAEDLGTAATFFGNTAIIAPAHYNENYVALARTMLAWGIGEH